MRFLAVFIAVIFSARSSPFAQESLSSDYAGLVALYGTAPQDALTRLLQLPPAAREKDVADAVSGANAWPWDDLAAAAMLETDAALTHLRRDDREGAPHLEAAERLLSRGLQAAPQQVPFVMRWYRGVAAVLRLNGALTEAQAIDRRPSREGDGPPWIPEMIL